MPKTTILCLLLALCFGSTFTHAQTTTYIYNPATDFYNTLPSDTTQMTRMLKAEGDYSAYRAKNARAENIDSLYYFEPLSLIFMIGEEDEKQSPDSTSAISYQHQTELLSQYGGHLKLSSKISTANIESQRALNTEIVQLMGQAAFRKKYFENRETPGTIDSLMRASGKRYGLITMHLGYLRTPRNLKHEKHKSIGMAILAGATGGIVAYTIYNSLLSFNQKSSSQFYVMIIDAKEHKTCYYKHYGTFMESDSPLSKNVLDRQFNLAFNGFFWKKRL